MQQSTFHQSNFGNSIDDFTADINTLNTNKKAGIQDTMINLTSPSESVDIGRGKNNKHIEKKKRIVILHDNSNYKALTLSK